MGFDDDFLGEDLLDEDDIFNDEDENSEGLFEEDQLREGVDEEELLEEDFYTGDSEETSENMEITGITDEVTSYTYTGLSYPCIVIKEDFKCPEHKMLVLSKMVKMSSREVKDIGVYFSNAGELFKIGTLSGSQIKAFYQIVGEDNVRAFYSEDKELLDDMKYVLSS